MHDYDDHTEHHVPLVKGTLVSHYRIVEKIGSGGMGQVYLAFDTKLERQVALKFLPMHLAGDTDLKKRFVREAKAAARLNHPNVVTVFEVGEFNGRPFFAMEHVRGESLHSYAHDNPQPVERVIDLAVQICEGLAEAHAAGIVHRDIKANNIVMDHKGKPRIVDFGLAAVEDDDNLTATGTTLGTVAYMAPEQVEGKNVDERSDLFSFGVVLYELLAGRTPFRRENPAATVRAIVSETPEPVSRFRANVPEDLERIIQKLLQKDPALRYQSAAGVISDLKLIHQGVSGPVSQVIAPRPRKPAYFIVGAAIIVVVLAAASFWWFGRGAATSSEKSTPRLVVLPFENLGSPDDEYFADGMTEEVTSRLAGFENLSVISRTSALTYKNSGKTLKEIGKELGVDYVLEGTVRWAKAGGQSRVRITPQLISVADDRHLWADNFERELTEVFEVQAQIAMSIVDELGITLGEGDRSRINDRPTNNVQAYDYYLKGLDYFWRVEGPADIEDVVRDGLLMFSRAIELDTSFALAYARKSVLHTWYFFSGFEGYRAHIDSARATFQRAFELKPGLPEAHMAKGIFYNLVETDYDKALAEFDIAEQGMPNNADLLSAIGLVQMRRGEWEDAASHYRGAIDRDPVTSSHYSWLAVCQLMTQNYQEAEWAINRAISIDPSGPGYYATKLYIYWSKYGDTNRMKQVMAEAKDKTDPVAVMYTTYGSFSNLGFWRLNLLDQPAEELVGKVDEGYSYSFAYAKYLNIGQIYEYLANDAERAGIYYDSARADLQRELDQYDQDFDIQATMGLTLALLGRFDEAIEHGLKGKELMSIDACHW